MRLGLEKKFLESSLKLAAELASYQIRRARNTFSNEKLNVRERQAKSPTV